MLNSENNISVGKQNKARLDFALLRAGVYLTEWDNSSDRKGQQPNTNIKILKYIQLYLKTLGKTQINMYENV